jgi:hypothetical protein
VVTIEFHYMTDIDWLAGRGYTMIHVWWPVTFNCFYSEIQNEQNERSKSANPFQPPVAWASQSFPR